MSFHIIVNCEKYQNEKEMSFFLKILNKFVNKNCKKLLIFKNQCFFQPILKKLFNKKFKIKNKSGFTTYLEIYKWIDDIVLNEKDVKIFYYNPEVDLFINKNKNIEFINGYFTKINDKYKNLFLNKFDYIYKIKKEFELIEKSKKINKEVKKIKESIKKPDKEFIDKIIYQFRISHDRFNNNDEMNKTQGINIDYDILENVFQELGFQQIKNIYLKKADFINLGMIKFDNNIWNWPLDGKYYLFSEIIFFEAFLFLLRLGKIIIYVPNLDAHNPYHKKLSWFKIIEKLSEYPNFYIFCKTWQVYNFLEEKKINLNKNIFINFTFYNKTLFIENKKEKYKNSILLDTGSSILERKYCCEIIDIFKNNPDLSFNLVIKTVPRVYQHFKLEKYETFNNILIINEFYEINELDLLYSQFSFFIYIAKFDGLGLSLSKAINFGLYIFAGDGLPWNELLHNYPRKTLINLNQDFTKSTGGGNKGFAYSSPYYKADFEDLLDKLSVNINDYWKIINETKEETSLFIKINKNIFLSNINKFLNKDKNKIIVSLCTFKERWFILLDNLRKILLDVDKIYIYLNSWNEKQLWFLQKMANVEIILNEDEFDYKALGKLFSLDKAILENGGDDNYFFIIDDDIQYPADYFSYTIDKLKKRDDLSNSIFSYNGFDENYKYSFTKKFKNEFIELNKIGTGTSFFSSKLLKNNKFDFNKLVLEEIENDKNQNIFCDNVFSRYCENNKINKKLINSKKFNWLNNHPKLKELCGLFDNKQNVGLFEYTQTAGLFEYKVKNQLIESKYKNVKIQKEISYKTAILFTINKCDKFSSEIYLNQSLNKYFFCQIYVFNEENIIENIDFTQFDFLFFNLKIDLVSSNTNKRLFDKIKILNKPIIGYTWDLIDFKQERKEVMLKNINSSNMSFITQEKYSNNENVFQIFPPTKVEKYDMDDLYKNYEIEKDNPIKIIHFGRISGKRFIFIKQIYELFKENNVLFELHGLIKVDLANKEIQEFLTYDNVKHYRPVFGKRIFDYTNKPNTFVLSINEITEYKYYSNRITMMCGYSALVLQEHFNKIEDDFYNNELLIFKQVEDIFEKIMNLKNNYNKQLEIRKKAYETSKKYSYDNYCKKIVETLEDKKIL